MTKCMSKRMNIILDFSFGRHPLGKRKIKTFNNPTVSAQFFFFVRLFFNSEKLILCALSIVKVLCNKYTKDFNLKVLQQTLSFLVCTNKLIKCMRLILQLVLKRLSSKSVSKSCFDFFRNLIALYCSIALAFFKMLLFCCLFNWSCVFLSYVSFVLSLCTSNRQKLSVSLLNSSEWISDANNRPVYTFLET